MLLGWDAMGLLFVPCPEATSAWKKDPGRCDWVGKETTEAMRLLQLGGRARGALMGICPWIMVIADASRGKVPLVDNWGFRTGAKGTIDTARYLCTWWGGRQAGPQLARRVSRCLIGWIPTWKAKKEASGTWKRRTVSIIRDCGPSEKQ